MSKDFSKTSVSEYLVSESIWSEKRIESKFQHFGGRQTRSRGGKKEKTETQSES